MSQQLEDDMDDNTNAPTCPACGVPYRDHLGLHGTCAALLSTQLELDELRDFLPALVLQALGVADGEQCPRCQGVGRYTYATTATWRGGYGGQAFTLGTCDCCWGSGTTEPWPSLREQADEAARLRAALVDSQRLYGAAHAKAEDLALALRDLDGVADLHRNLNRRTAEALGLGAVRVDPETGRRYLPSWHDMPERVAALRAALAEVLEWMTEAGHPGENCLRSGWVRAERVAELRRLVDGGR